MKDKQELLKELEAKFEETKKELGFKASLQEINKVFFIKDSVLGAGFVSENFSRQLCSRIVETYANWNNYLHSLIMPNPGHMLNMTESKMLDETEKKEIMNLLGKAIAITSTNTLIGLTKEKSEEGKFVDSSLKFWKDTFSPYLTKLIKKINFGWKKK